jgi:hypothetical protein
LLPVEKHRHSLNVINGRPLDLIIKKLQTHLIKPKSNYILYNRDSWLVFLQDSTSVNTWQNVKSIYSSMTFLWWPCMFLKIMSLLKWPQWTKWFFLCDLLNLSSSYSDVCDFFWGGGVCFLLIGSLCTCILIIFFFKRICTHVYFNFCGCTLTCPCNGDIYFGNDDT